ncbi:ExeA family protein [Aliiroseovarius sp. PTFE2010]|uniref:ExeA family protein n=1 Tax=Aliiroseovarius sp. PTFE2010 TaxID=3417190 RepID=UPI003CF5BFAB
MCSWERYCAFAREPERRKVGADARVAVSGTHYEVDPDLAGEDVLLWWGLFDTDLFVEWNERRFGPYRPSGGPIPLRRYRKPGKSVRKKRSEAVVALADAINLPRTVVAGGSEPDYVAEIVPFRAVGFEDPDPWQELTFASALAARRANSDQLRRPLGELGSTDLALIADLVERTLDKAEIRTAIREHFMRTPENEGMLTSRIRDQFKIAKDWREAGHFETARMKQISAHIRAAIMAGRLIAVSGPVGAGKTVALNCLKSQMTAEGKVIVVRSLSIERHRITLSGLITALFLDISGDPNLKVPTQPERRERLLQDLVRAEQKPVALFIDAAHDLHGQTLNGLKRLIEMVDEGGGTLSVVLVGHPRLHNNLRRPVMEEIGHRTAKIEFGGLGDEGGAFIDWLLKSCLADGVKQNDVITADARAFLAETMATPLQIIEHLNRAFMDVFRLGADIVTREIVEDTISAGFEDLDARLTRIGYPPKAFADQFDTRLPEIRRFLTGRLDTERTEEITAMMRRAGLPVCSPAPFSHSMVRAR